ncbi:MAG: hypothetical protein O2943_03885 [Actinomycetota bacterium]|nr:hypothetical protein [Actinomycetota bacterium]
MSTAPNRPIFWFLWPQEKTAVDGDFRQIRMLRIPARGPWRLILLVAATLLLVMLGGVAIMGSAGAGLFPVLLTGAVLASALLVLLRGWSIGTYVNDAGFAIRRMFTSTIGSWSSVVNTDRTDGQVVLHLVDGSTVSTHIARNSLDTWLRPSAYDAATISIENWSAQH